MCSEFTSKMSHLHATCGMLYSLNRELPIFKLDGVGLVDNRPSTTLSEKKEKKCDT